MDAFKAKHDEAGSSPRARGTPDALGRAQKVERFIPACAGNTLAQLP